MDWTRQKVQKHQIPLPVCKTLNNHTVGFYGSIITAGLVYIFLAQKISSMKAAGLIEVAVG